MKTAHQIIMSGTQLRSKVYHAMEAHGVDKNELSNFFGYITKNEARRSKLIVSPVVSDRTTIIVLEDIKNIKQEVCMVFFHIISDIMSDCSMLYSLDYNQSEYIGLFE